MFASLHPDIPFFEHVTSVTVCDDGIGCVDRIEVFEICGQTVYVGKLTPTYVVMPGTPCSAIHEPMRVKTEEGSRR